MTDSVTDNDETAGTLKAATPAVAAESHRNPRPLWRATVIIAAYLFWFIVLDLFSKQFEELGGVVAWYPPAGLTYTLLLVFGVRFAPAVTIALFTSSMFIYRMPQSPYLLFLWALIISLIYSMAAAFLRHRIHIDWQLRKLRDVTWFVSVTVLVSALLAVLSVSSSALSSDMPRGEVLHAIFLWWIGESVGILTVAPFLLIYVMPGLKRFAEGQALGLPKRAPLPHPTLSVLGQAASLAVTLYWVFGVRVLAEYHPFYLITLPLIWIALQRGLKQVSAAMLALNSGVVLALWLFRFDTARLGELELLMIVNCIVGLLMGAAVTEQKQAVEALRESEKRFREVLENSLDASYKRNLQTGAYDYLSPVFARIAGYTPDEFRTLPTETDLDLVHPDDRDRVGRTLAESLSGVDGMPNQVDYRFKHKDGQYRWFHDQFIVVRDAQGRPAARIGSASDITERKRSDEERDSLQGQLLQAQKMEAVGRLAGGVAHDFNNMLTVILGHAEMGLLETDREHPLYGDLLEIKKATERSADLTAQLLAFARRQTVAPRVLDLNDTIESMLKMLRRLIGEDILLAWLPEADLWSVKMDPVQVDQILANLCVNARDAIAGVGRVTIETGNVVFDAAYCAEHVGATPGEYVLLAVSDDGSGMDKDMQEHLFEPFFTTKGVGQGTGLGLATVYGIVTQNNGMIHVYSEPGHGSTFRIYIPRHAGASLHESEASAPAMPLGQGEVLLLVDDEPAIAAMGKAMLGRLGYTVLAAETAGEALLLAGQHEGQIDLLITDVVMPEMSGRELCERLQATRPEIRCLYMSGYTANVIAHRGVLDEGVQFIQKPFSSAGLAAKVREALRQA